MNSFKSTSDFMELLKSEKYGRPVMENEEEFLVSQEAFDLVTENFKARVSRPDNYSYFTRKAEE